MSETKALQAIEQPQAAEPQAMTIAEMTRMAEMFARSGMFQDARDVAKAFVRIQAGRELGVPPFASMRGVHIIQGQAALSATLVAGCMKAHGYSWEEIKRDEDQCSLRIFKPNGKVAGVSSFSMADAKAAGLDGKDIWRKYRKSMLFARAITDAARTWAPEVFSGIPVYTPEELEDADPEPKGRTVEPVKEQQPVELSDDPRTAFLEAIEDTDTVTLAMRSMYHRMAQVDPAKGPKLYAEILFKHTGHEKASRMPINKHTLQQIRLAAGEMWDNCELAESLGVEEADAAKPEADPEPAA